MLVNSIKEQVLIGLIEVQKIPSKDNMADKLTKALDWKEFESKAVRILGLDHLEQPGDKADPRLPDQDAEVPHR